jgi:hypothetical protein
VSRDECLHLNDILGVETLGGCSAIRHALPGADDKFFTVSNKSEAFSDERDQTMHRNSWLMPRMARRMTQNNKYHASQARADVMVDEAECAKLRALLTERMGSPLEAEPHIPAACKRN